MPIKRTKKALQKRIAAIAVFPPVQEIDGGRRASGHFRPPPTAAFILRVCSSFNFHSPEFLHFSKFSNIPNLIQSPILSLRQLGGISSSILKQRTLGRHFRSRNHALCATAPASNSCNAIARSLSLCSGRHPSPDSVVLGVNSIDINLGPKTGPKIGPRCKIENTVLKWARKWARKPARTRARDFFIELTP